MRTAASSSGSSSGEGSSHTTGRRPAVRTARRRLNSAAPQLTYWLRPRGSLIRSHRSWSANSSTNSPRTTRKRHGWVLNTDGACPAATSSRRAPSSVASETDITHLLPPTLPHPVRVR